MIGTGIVIRRTTEVFCDVYRLSHPECASYGPRGGGQFPPSPRCATAHSRIKPDRPTPDSLLPLQRQDLPPSDEPPVSGSLSTSFVNSS